MFKEVSVQGFLPDLSIQKCNYEELDKFHRHEYYTTQLYIVL